MKRPRGRPPDAEAPGLDLPGTSQDRLALADLNPEGSGSSKGVKGDVAERFWSKVDRRGERDCWLWTASGERYGKFTLPTGRRPSRQVGAHRVAYMLAVGPIPPGFVVHHVCRQTLCCNPSHLRADTQSANVLRDQSPPARNASKQECIHGHPLRGDNVRIYTRRSGEVERVCVACERNRNHAAAQARSSGA